MRRFTMETHQLAAAVLLCVLPMSAAAKSDTLNPGTQQNPTTHEIGEYSVLLNGGGYYRITGDATNIMTDSIHFAPDTANPYYVTLEHVHIDTSDVESELCGLFIPQGTTVNLYLYGSSSVKGSGYGIYVSENATLNIECELDDALVIEGDHGIYNAGNFLTIDGNPLYPETDAGQANITAKYYGIYSKNGLEIKATDMNITVTGSSTDSQPVVGIRLGVGQDRTNDLSNNVVKIDASAGKGTYGMWLEENANLFCMGMDLTVSATRCVLHHISYYGGNYQWFTGGGTRVHLTGPFDGPHPGVAGGEGDWYCDATISSETDFVLDDKGDFPFHHTLYGVEKAHYANRVLYKGWNTLCLPFAYSTETAEDDDTDEARKWIDDYTVFSGITTEPDADDETSENSFLNFTSIAKGSTLEANKAYLIHVNDDMLFPGQDEIKVQFTATNENIEKPLHRKGDFLKTVFYKTTLEKSDSIFKLGRTRDAEGNVRNYFNRSEGASIAPYRAYIKTDEELAAKKLGIKFNDGETTSIDRTDRPAQNDGRVKIYNINGQLVSDIRADEGQKALEQLPKGIYIMNGKKYVCR